MKTFTYQFPRLIEALLFISRYIGHYPLSYSGDYGQDESKGQSGIGCDAFGLVIEANGRATLVIDWGIEAFEDTDYPRVVEA